MTTDYAGTRDTRDRRADMTTELDQTAEADIQKLLLGRRIVGAEKGSFDFPGREWREPASGRLTLDDGTQIYVIPNQGGCGCGAGDYDLTSLATVDNIITSVRLAVEGDGDYEDRSYRIYVVADATEINAIEIDGNDGSGYYGTGYELVVIDPEVMQ